VGLSAVVAALFEAAPYLGRVHTDTELVLVLVVE
jgi:hypothetical protein